MMKFILASRRKPGDTQERFFYEWGIIHVALMISTPEVMRIFQRYVQHYSISGVDAGKLRHAFSSMEWDNMADHWLVGDEEAIASVKNLDYVTRMQPHSFGDRNFAIQLCDHVDVYECEGFRHGGVKLSHFLKAKPGVSLRQFNQAWRAHGETVASLAKTTGIVKKYVQGTQRPFDANVYKGSLFEFGSVNGYAGVEEYWFDSLDDLYRLKTDKDICAALDASEKAFVDAAGSFAMVTTERVIYDYTKGDKSSPKPAVLDPDSLEAAIYRQGLRDWNVPKPGGIPSTMKGDRR